MATPPPNQNPTRINAPLNFRHTDTLTTTKVPHYPTKLTTGMSIIPGWNRPNANGQNANINDKDYNGPDFKPRPLKHWRKQLGVYDHANNSRTATISQLDRPGSTVYNFKPDCSCIPGEGGNSYIISNNKFGYETKDDNYSKAGSDTQIQNNGFTVVPYNATEAQINDPTNPAYKVLTGVYNTNCVNCSPQGNLIKSGIAPQSQAYYSYSNDKLETRCQTYEQNISTNKAEGCVYFDAQGVPLWPNNLPNGPQVVAPVNYEPLRLLNKPCLSETIYKPNNIGFGLQGAVSGSTRLKKLVSDTVTMNGSSFYSAKGAQEANLGKYQGNNIAGNYYVKTKEVTNSCTGTVPGKPVLTVIDNDINSITFSWEDTGSTLCKVSYYSLTYYAIRILGTVRELSYDNDTYNNNNDNTNIKSFTSSRDIPMVDTAPVYDNSIYTDLDNNIKYTIISTINTNEITYDTIDEYIRTYKLTGLTKNTNYIAYITGVNGNGEGETSDKVLTETIIDPNIMVNIQPPYSYEYNDTPIILPGYATSDTQTVNSKNIIRTSISYDTTALYKNVALIFSNNNIKNTFKVLLQNSGVFKVYALQPKFGEYGLSSVLSIPIVVAKSTPTISFTNSITGNLIYGRTYPLSNAIIGNTNTKQNDGVDIKLSYNISNTSSAIILSKNIGNIITSNNPVIYVTGMTPFYIIISTILNDTLSQNYNSVTYNTDTFTINKSTPSLITSSKLITSGTYGSPYIFYPPSINYNPTLQPQGSIPQVLYYKIINDSPPGIASINNSGEVTISGAGTFNIYSYCNSTSTYNDGFLNSPTITINKQNPTITFPSNFVTSVLNDLPYLIVPATVNNNIQTLSYSIVNSIPANNVVNISKIYDNTNTGDNSSNIQYSPVNSNTLSKISYEIITPSDEGILKSISFQQVNANIPQNYYIVSIYSDSHNIDINSTYSTYNNPDGRSLNNSVPTPSYPAFPNFSSDIMSSIVDDIYVNNISIALAYPASVGATSYFACDLFTNDTVTGLPVNITNNQLIPIQIISGVSGGTLYMYKFSCNVILTEKQLATSTLVVKNGSTASFYPSVNGSMYIEINYISILKNKCSIVSIPASTTTVQNFDLKDFSILMHPVHSYTISLWLLGTIIKNNSGYNIYSGNGTICSTSTATPYIYGTMLQNIPITTITDISKPIYFDDVGTFNISVSCNSSLNYNASNIISKKIVVAEEVPIITFSKNLNIMAIYNVVFSLPNSIATVNNNIQNIFYSLVNTDDGITPSTVATINTEGTEIKINRIGTFKIKASVIESANLDFSDASALSDIITINKATPSIIFSNTFIKQVTYLKNYTYQIVGVSTTNTDTSSSSILSYSSTNTSVATISGTTVTILGVGSFNINVTCSSTNNFNEVKNIQSPPITVIKATPSITFPSDFGKTWSFTSLTPYNLSGISSNNTDSDIKYTYTILNTSVDNIAQIIQPTQPTEVAKIKINNAGTFTLQVEISSTQNFNGSSGRMYIIIPKITPIITFNNALLDNSWIFDGTPYVFTPPSIINYDPNDPNQKITYSIITVFSPDSIANIASFLDPTIPSVTILSAGKFKIKASCLASKNGNYTAPTAPSISDIITIGSQTPKITFSNKLTNNITYKYNTNYTLPQPIATVNNSVQTRSYFSYLAVNIDSDIPSTIASISYNNASLIINSVGSFRIYATVQPSIDYEYTYNEDYYNITVTPATPTITKDLVPPPAWAYNSTYTIPYPTTSNTDTSPAPVISYSTDYPNIITIKGTKITVVGVGLFNIIVNIGPTKNYTSLPPLIYSYLSVRATPVITFPGDFATSIDYDNSYTLIPATATNIDNLTQPIIYDIYPTTSTVASISYFRGNPSVTINSVGSFQIQASCPVSSNGLYDSIPWGQVISPTVIVAENLPNIIFNTGNFNNSYVYVYNNTPSIPLPIYKLTAPIAHIDPPNTGQTLRYSIVTYDSTINSVTTDNTIANIDSIGTYLTINSVGQFKIYAEADETPYPHDFGPCSSISNIISITPATPTIMIDLVPPSTWAYNSTYTIPYPTVYNTDTTPPEFSYSTDNHNIITIFGTEIKVVGIGAFNIKLTVGATKNYTSKIFTYPSPTSYYNSTPAKPIIDFTQKNVISAVYGSPYTFNPATISNNDPSQTITYSIISISPSNAIVASFLDPSKASATINLAGTSQSQATFQIKASCSASSNGYYTEASDILPDPLTYISVTREVPNIVFNSPFNTDYQASYTYSKTSQPISTTIASITPNPGDQILTYYAVMIDSDADSDIATVSSDGTTLTTISVGTFRILAKTLSSGVNYGDGHDVSKIITINKATPIIQSFSALSPPPAWVYDSINPQSYSIAYPVTTNTDINTDINTQNIISYSIKTPSDIANALVSRTTILSIDVGKFQIVVNIAETTNYNANSFTYPSPTTYYTFIAKPVIDFTQKNVTSAVYGSLYTFFPATISNNDPSQTITYSIISISPPNTIVASFLDPSKPSATINLAGTSQIQATFQIKASCTANGYYTEASDILPDPLTYISVTREVPNIVFNSPFNTDYQASYTYSKTSQPISTTIASITPNPGDQILTYYAVMIDSDADSDIATVSSDGTTLTTISVGTFRILAKTLSSGVNYGDGHNFSKIININKATPIIQSFSALSPPPAWVYDELYNIPYPITSNNDTTPAPKISYSTDNPNIILIAGTQIKVIGVGAFNIKVTIEATTNYISPPQPFVYSYTSTQAETVVQFPDSFHLTATYSIPYTFVPIHFSEGEPLQQTVTYTIV